MLQSPEIEDTGQLPVFKMRIITITTVISVST